MRINLFRLRANRFFSQGNSFQCRFSTASSSVKGIEFVGEAVESENLFFPWRKRPESDSYRRTLVAKLLLNQIQSEIDFLNGSLMAFQESVRSIFLHRDMVQHNTHINARFPEKLPLIDENYQSLPLEEVFEDRLAKFYANAVKNILLESECKVFYSLSSLNRSEIVRSDLLLYSEVDKVEHEFLERDNTKFGLGILRPQSREGVTPSDEEKINGNPIIDNIITNLKSSKDLSVNEPDSLLLRIWVDIHCKEIFYVKNARLGVIIQGSEAPTSTIHQILFENSIRIEDLKHFNFRYIDSWKIVDIDHWMEKNDDWLQFRFHHQSL